MKEFLGSIGILLAVVGAVMKLMLLQAKREWGI
jgi:hypothetical protein